MPWPVFARWRARLPLRSIDLLWLVVMAALAALASTRPRHSPYEFVALGAIALVQIAEMRFGFLQHRRGAVAAVAVKLALAWILVWETEGIESSYYLIFLLPVVSAASAFGLPGTVLTALASSLAYCSFLIFVWDRYELAPGGERELGIRILFLFMTGILLNYFVTENRRQAERYRKLAEDLAAANRELGEAQAQIRRSERLAALGQLSAGLAHELRNPLGVIRASAELVGKNVTEENAVAQEMSSLIAREVDRTNALVTRFLDFARPSQLRRAPHDLHEVLRHALDHVRRGMANGAPRVEFATEFSSEVRPFPFDAELMERVFYNLLLNGAQAMPQGGTLLVVTRSQNGMVETEITDTGAGIAEENMESIFNPFFTTKPDGVGLGLAIVSKIVDDHGGRISVSSRVGRGTTFRISLPAPETAA
jgi:two-component system sensor histidine kinase HydH